MLEADVDARGASHFWASDPTSRRFPNAAVRILVFLNNPHNKPGDTMEGAGLEEGAGLDETSPVSDQLQQTKISVILSETKDLSANSNVDTSAIGAPRSNQSTDQSSKPRHWPGAVTCCGASAGAFSMGGFISTFHALFNDCRTNELIGRSK